MADQAALFSPGPGLTRGPGRQALLRDGEDGAYYASWYPVCLSRDVAVGQVIGTAFLGGRIAIFRGTDGAVSVVSAYCPHMGADLSGGRVVGERLQCPMHHWEFAASGRCLSVACDDPVPPGARLHRFPVTERWGIVFAFNGAEPLWPINGFSVPDEQILFEPAVAILPCEGWIFAANTPDMQHIKALHGFDFKGAPTPPLEWTDWGHRYRLQCVLPNGWEIDWRLGVDGTSIFMQEGTIDGHWHCVVNAYGAPKPGEMASHAFLGAHQGDGSPAQRASALERLARWSDYFMQQVSDDYRILSAIKYRRGLLTRSDRQAAEFLDFLGRYPRQKPPTDLM